MCNQVTSFDTHTSTFLVPQEFDDPRDAEDAVYEMNGRDFMGERLHSHHLAWHTVVRLSRAPTLLLDSGEGERKSDDFGRYWRHVVIPIIHEVVTVIYLPPCTQSAQHWLTTKHLFAIHSSIFMERRKSTQHCFVYWMLVCQCEIREDNLQKLCNQV